MDLGASPNSDREPLTEKETEEGHDAMESIHGEEITEPTNPVDGKDAVIDLFKTNLMKKVQPEGAGSKLVGAGRNSLKGTFAFGKAFTSLSFREKKSSDPRPEYVSKRLDLDLEKLKQEGDATYILDESVLQGPVDGDNVKEIN